MFEDQVRQRQRRVDRRAANYATDYPFDARERVERALWLDARKTRNLRKQPLNRDATPIEGLAHHRDR